MIIKKIISRTEAANTSKLEANAGNALADSPLLNRIYQSRGVQSKAELQYDLSQLANYKLLSNIDAAVAALVEMINTHAKVIIVGDFDADGATSTALLMEALPAMGLKHLSYVVPNRFEYGYGLSEKIVREVSKDKPDWIITVDNGISNHAGVRVANELGIKVLITDHHLPAETLPEAAVIVNPNLRGDQFPSKALAGVGVAFYILIALRAELRAKDYFNRMNITEPNLAEWLDLVALGTVADVVPLDVNNRILVAQGLKRIRAGKCRPAIKLLLEVAKRTLSKVEASDLGFAVGPRLNAAGRLEDMSVGIECLLAKSEQQAQSMVFELDSLNQYRREIESHMVEDALKGLADQIGDLEQHRPNSVCLFRDDWHQGVVGLVASRIKEKLNRPVIAFAPEDELTVKGSGRSVPGVHMRDVLANVASKYPELLQKFGGHAMAAGLSIKKQQLSEFQKKFDEEVNHWLGKEIIDDSLITDGELDKSECSLQTAELLKQSGPWGQGFPEPIFHGEFEVVQQRILADKHLKLVVQNRHQDLIVDAIYFFAPEQCLSETLNHVELVYKLSVNEFRGNTSLQLIVVQLSAFK
ncbi:single-stranded-DNA-specific exonuclease RecJ [Pleionea mediterranea]|uniref:Single-stranded-DNA-specific exonuclease RecJ n=1 Tax=Pleionea mediterranea TaxID=523701 RepID=A0A316G0W8_9GAMM|nr:single-stranded-DNA-specific exonuclease RecJ [Pleionea mediterranea]PWK54448.1 exonuclease RecJ [Pleionea mediterranea]